MKPISWFWVVACCSVLSLLVRDFSRNTHPAFAASASAGKTSDANTTAASPSQPAPSRTLAYDKDGNFLLPANYREWIFLSAGIDMAYGPKGVAATKQSMFDNVFVDPDAYRYFLAKGTWPDKTVMILEGRGAETNVSINHGGHSQGAVMAVEVHLKDATRFSPDKWAFFDVKPSGVGTLIAKTADCYSCHQQHAAVDTTFVQFYPTLLPVAKEKGTLSSAFLEEQAAQRAQ